MANNGGFSRDDGNDRRPHRSSSGDSGQLQQFFQPPPPPQPPAAYGYPHAPQPMPMPLATHGHGYPNYGYNTQNPPTNLWGPSNGFSNIAASQPQQPLMIPDNVVITNNFSDAASWTSNLSMPTMPTTTVPASSLDPMTPVVVSSAMPSLNTVHKGQFSAMPTAQMLPQQVPLQQPIQQQQIQQPFQYPQQQQQIQQSQFQQQQKMQHTQQLQVQQQQVQIHQQIQIQNQQQPNTNLQPAQERAIHTVNLSSIRHNFNQVQSSASQQQCQVIVVVKADGYGHGAILTACHLVERCGAEAFAVATVEEGISLRRAFEERFSTPEFSKVRILVLGAPVGYPNCFDTYLHNDIELMVSGPEVAASLAKWMKNHDGRRRAEVERVAERRKEELMDEYAVSGGDWKNPMRNGVVRQLPAEGVCETNQKANGELLKEDKQGAVMPVTLVKNEGYVDGKEESTCNTTITSNEKDQLSGEDHNSQATPQINANQEALNGMDENPRPVSPSKLQRKYNAATLTNVTGDDLAREVRQILIGQRHATAKAHMATIPEPSAEVNAHPNGAPIKRGSDGGSAKNEELKADNAVKVPAKTPKPDAAAATPVQPAKKAEGETLFRGIDDAARASRQKELRAIRLSQHDETNIFDEDAVDLTGDGNTPQIRKKLRWHALVDSGMGRLGFKTDVDEHVAAATAAEDGLSDGSLSSSDHSSGILRDTVSIIKELYDAEVHEGAPIEFFGMCTHMADANSTSTYTNDQMSRFRALLLRIRSAGIAVPTISTDNSAALLTTSLNHFDPDAILAHDTRGFVRCGGAIYGQRPAFRQLRAVSTLSATVKHVAIIKQGESVGYDRAYVAPLDVRIATLTVGFADGYPRELGNGVGKVSICGTIFPVAGNVCMDMLMVDLGPADGAGSGGAGSTVAVGDKAVLWGPEETNVEECGDGLVPLAELAGSLKTTQSALTCGLDKLRVQRQLVE